MVGPLVMGPKGCTPIKTVVGREVSPGTPAVTTKVNPGVAPIATVKEGTTLDFALFPGGKDILFTGGPEAVQDTDDVTVTTET